MSSASRSAPDFYWASADLGAGATTKSQESVRRASNATLGYATFRELERTGHGDGERAQQAPGTCDLDVWQEDIPAGMQNAPDATIPGLKEIRGTVDPVCCFGREDLILTMEDGRKLKFFFTDMNGSIALRSWIG